MLGPLKTRQAHGFFSTLCERYLVITRLTCFAVHHRLPKKGTRDCLPMSSTKSRYGDEAEFELQCASATSYPTAKNCSLKIPLDIRHHGRLEFDPNKCWT